MMRDDLLKRLDEIVNYAIGSMEEDYIPEETQAEWVALRAEIVNERCENCKSWGWTWPGLVRTGACDELPVRPVTKPNFYCAYFVKK